MPVHDVALWTNSRVRGTLLDALNFLTGDAWDIDFHPRRRSADVPQQGLLTLDRAVDAVIPFSNGLDSRAVAGLTARSMGNRLVRVRLGSRLADGEGLRRERHAFTAVPFEVTADKGVFVESTARSRGFKFALVSGIAAYLAGAARRHRAGERAGRARVRRSSPSDRLTRTTAATRCSPAGWRGSLEALLGYKRPLCVPADSGRRRARRCVSSSTLAPMTPGRRHGPAGRASARSASMAASAQCGICAACMLRRMSIHAAGLSEPPERYVWERLTTRAFEDGAEPSFRAKGKITGALREYAIAGALHLDHLAVLAGSAAHDRAIDARRLSHWRGARPDAGRRARPA